MSVQGTMRQLFFAVGGGIVIASCLLVGVHLSVSSLIAATRTYCLEGVRNFELDLVSWRNEKTQAIPNGCVG
jgi:hypothetical protein